MKKNTTSVCYFDSVFYQHTVNILQAGNRVNKFDETVHAFASGLSPLNNKTLHELIISGTILFVCSKIKCLCKESQYSKSG